LLLAALVALAAGGLVVQQRGKLARPGAAPGPAAALVPARQEGVAALGRLDPRGDVRKLAAPSGGNGGGPRIAVLLVKEGDAVQAGQLLARFDSRPGLMADRSKLTSRIANLDRRLVLQNRDIARYRQLSRTGAYPSGELEGRETRLLELQALRADAQAELQRVEAELALTELRAPIAGTVLRLNAREGERPTDTDGVLELGASAQMEALVEVYESDIGRVRIGQAVSLVSENGGFQGSLAGRVIRINPQVRQRQLLATDPTGDADARIVEVRVSLDAADSRRVSNLTGLKVIARLQP
jgi:HlyD family secretion protein